MSFNDNNNDSVCIDGVVINEVFYRTTQDNEDTVLTRQFAITGKSLEKRYPTKKLNADQFANLCNSISQGIINVKSIKTNHIEQESNSESDDKKKVIKKIDKLKMENIQSKLLKQLQDMISYMKPHELEILDGNCPSVVSLQGIIQLYRHNIANKIIKGIILRALTKRFINTADNNLIPLIFEFIMVLNEFRDEWFIMIDNHTTNKTENGNEVSTGRVNHRKARKEANKTSTVSDFEYPSLDELKSSVLSDRIKLSFVNYVNEANKIIGQRNIDPIKYQMVDTYYRLKPLSSWDPKVMKLDDWQLEVINYIDNNESVVITAPTSSGKTVCAQYCATNENISKVLFVVPCSVLANQVAGSFTVAGIKTALITNEEDYNSVKDSKVIVATPAKAEDILITMCLDLSYAVFDEIQQINDNEGECIQRLIKTVNCPFLILSATINEPERFVEYLNLITKRDVKLVSYNKRFIIQQKHIWNGQELITLHPLACVDTDYIINDKFTTGDLAMTARDLYVLGCDLANDFNEYNEDMNIHPNRFFDQNTSIDMDRVSQYDTHIKNILIRLTLMHEDRVKIFLEKYNIDQILTDGDVISKIVELMNTLKKKDMLPTLMFMLNDIAVLNTFKKIILYLEQMEQYYFPWYQNFMISLYEEVNEYSSKEHSLKESIAKGLSGKGNKIKEIESQINQQKRIFIQKFLDKINVKYCSEFSKAKESKKYTDKELDMIKTFLNKDFNNKKLQYQINQKDSMDVKLPQFNPYCPTSLFSFHTNALSVETMRKVKMNLRKFLTQTVDKSIAKDMSYDNIFIRGLERGLILYSKILPTPFQRVVQELIVSHQAPICICDDSLAYGVNYPTRTVVILGNEDNEDISVLKAQQISGRSGRRGFDTQGNIVYFRVNYKNIMRGTYTPLIGKDTITKYTLLPAKIFDNPKYIVDVIETPLSVFMNNQTDQWNKQELLESFKDFYEDESFKQDGIMTLLLWLYRDEPNIGDNIFVFVDEIVKYRSHVKVDIIKNKKEDNDDNDNKSNSSNETVSYKMQTNYVYQLVELIMRVFDRADDIDDEINDEIIICANDEKFVELINSDKFPLSLNRGNSELIRSIIQNTNNVSDFGQLADIINRIHHVILNVLKLNNLFADIGNKTMVGILDQPITYLINYSNKLKSLN